MVRSLEHLSGIAPSLCEIKDCEKVLEAKQVSVTYNKKVAIESVSFSIPQNRVIAVIGPSGCGKSTLLRCFNRMNELIPNTKFNGEILFKQGTKFTNIYNSKQNPIKVRFQIGMVFQKPNPFPMSIYNNITFGLKVNGIKANHAEVVENSLRRAALWDEVKDRLKDNALSLSGGQQQRLCIARALATKPRVILMDEPASALDPIATQRIEDLIHTLHSTVTIIIVTHNLQQAIRVSHYIAVMMTDETRVGRLIEYGDNAQVFGNPKHPHTEDYVTGRIG